ncbi:AAA family ATPase [Vibrio splendidus]
MKIEENNEAISILNKFSYLDECLVCDSDINSEDLIRKKKSNIEVVSKKLTPEQKALAGQLISGLPLSDPFKTRDRVREAIAHSDRETINQLVDEFISYAEIIPLLIINKFIDEVGTTGLIKDFNDYSKLIEGKLEFENDDILFIEKFLSESLDRPISLERDEEHNIKLLLGGEEFLNKERVKLALSNGEQNFLSLAFELLKAKNAEQDLIVLDDPISSFDSIYKNKLAFAIIKFLSNKKSILLTHNTDLVKLLEHQVEKCFNLYYFNNTFDEMNGFLRINDNEVDVVLYIHKLLDLFRGDIKSEIIDEKKFLVSVAPFLRGYCQIAGYNDYKNDITKIMHGYNTEKVDLSKIYNEVIGGDVIKGSYHISAKDIIGFDVNDLNSIRSGKYSLLEKTLRHSLTYLFLRLRVEGDLVSKFNINTKKFDMLTKIITRSFNGKEKDDVDNRVFFMSRKTLLNEFNHFDMDMNFFQPAIDITNATLDKEKVSILERLDNI